MMNDRLTLLIGNDNYQAPCVPKLRGCKNDCNAIEPLLNKNEDGGLNFTSDKQINRTNEQMKTQILKRLNESWKSLVFFFSGHGYIDEKGGYICGIDASKNDIGISMSWLSKVINESNIREVTVILDCCHAGEMFNVKSEKGEFATLRQGVSVLAASRKDQKSVEFLGRGIFTSIIEEGLNGAAKDISGHVSVAGLYGCADRMLSSLQQRPVFKSFVDEVSPLRKCSRIVEKDVLNQIITDRFFSDIDYKIRINRDILEKKKTDFDIDFDTFLVLQSFENAGMIMCDTGKSLLETAFGRGTCQLNAYGQHIWRSIKKGEDI